MFDLFLCVLLNYFDYKTISSKIIDTIINNNNSYYSRINRPNFNVYIWPCVHILTFSISCVFFGKARNNICYNYPSGLLAKMIRTPSTLQVLYTMMLRNTWEAKGKVQLALSRSRWLSVIIPSVTSADQGHRHNSRKSDPTGWSGWKRETGWAMCVCSSSLT